MDESFINHLDALQSPFFNPVWLFALLLGWLGIYVAVVVSDNYGPGAFFFGLLLMGSGFFIGVFADDTLAWLIRHLASAPKGALG